MPSVKRKGREGKIAPTHANDPTEVVVFYFCFGFIFTVILPNEL